MNKSDQANFVLPGKTYDTALPQPWVEIMNKENGIPYRLLIGCFVWLYDEKAKCFGRPYPINMGGWVAAKMGEIEWV